MNQFTNYELRFTRANRRSRWVKSRAFSGLSNRQSQIVNRKYEGFEIRLPPTAEEPRIHRRGCAHPWAWDWSGDGHVRPHSGGSAVATALCQTGPARSRVAGQNRRSGLPGGMHYRPVAGMAESKPGPPGAGVVQLDF